MKDLQNLQNMTDVFVDYEKGKNYNNTLNLFNKTDKQYNFYHGNQWEGAELGNVQPITLNVIKPIVKFKVGVVKTNQYQVVFNPNTWLDLDEYKRLEKVCHSLNRYVNRIWELEQVKFKTDEALKDSCICSEGIVHSYEENGDIKLELLDKVNIFYGNENDDSIQDQPYIIISYRKTVDSVKEEARRNGVKEEIIDSIVSDQEYFEQTNRDKRINEVSPMCLVLLKYYKKDGTVWIKKCTRTVTIMPESDTKLTYYPIAHMLWERIKGYSRGIGEVEQQIPNQIEINKTATRRAIAVMIGAYPKLVANTEYISNPDALNEVGSTIELTKIPANNVRQVVDYLNPASISSDAFNLQQDLIDRSQQLAGAGDTVTGNVDPTKASGRAILALQQQAQQPINEQLNSFKVFLEDIARIWFNMLQVYSVKGIIVTEEIKDPVTGKITEEPYEISYEELNNLKPNIKIDITPKSSYDKLVQEQSLENLLSGQYITFEEYVKSLDDDAMINKPKLEKILKDRHEQEQQMQQIQLEANAMDSALNQVMDEENQTLMDNEINSIAQQGESIAQGGIYAL